MTTNSPSPSGLEGLADWLRAMAFTSLDKNKETLKGWADAVEALHKGAGGPGNTEVVKRLRQLAEVIDPPQIAVQAESRADAAKAMREAADLLQYGNCSYWCPACHEAVSKPVHEAGVRVDRAVELVDCAMCRGVGRHGTPGAHCSWCDGTGKVKRLAAIPGTIGHVAPPGFGAMTDATRGDGAERRVEEVQRRFLTDPRRQRERAEVKGKDGVSVPPPSASDGSNQPAEAVSEPVAWIRDEDLRKLKELGANADVALLGYKAMAFTTPLYTRPMEAERDAAMRNALFEAGWRTAAKWANRDDLYADTGSAAYKRDRDAVLSELDAAILEGVKNGD